MIVVCGDEDRVNGKNSYRLICSQNEVNALYSESIITMLFLATRRFSHQINRTAHDFLWLDCGWRYGRSQCCKYGNGVT